MDARRVSEAGNKMPGTTTLHSDGPGSIRNCPGWDERKNTNLLDFVEEESKKRIDELLW